MDSTLPETNMETQKGTQKGPYQDYSPSKRGLYGFPKIRGTILGVSRIRTIVYWGLYWGPPLFWETTIWVSMLVCGVYYFGVYIGPPTFGSCQASATRPRSFGPSTAAVVAALYLRHRLATTELCFLELLCKEG